MDEDHERGEVKAEARRLHQQAKRWRVEIPEEWYVTVRDPNDDFESFIGGVYHDRVKAKIQNARWALLTSGIGLVGGILGIAAFIRSC